MPELPSWRFPGNSPPWCARRRCFRLASMTRPSPGLASRVDRLLTACIMRPLPVSGARAMYTVPKIQALEAAQLRSGHPDFRVGDTVRVHYKIVEGDKDRIQVFQGVVIKKHRAGLRSSFTVRKVSFNVGVERMFMLHSPRLDKIEVTSRGVVRRGRL